MKGRRKQEMAPPDAGAYVYENLEQSKDGIIKLTQLIYLIQT